jgi:hypothetical protein
LAQYHEKQVRFGTITVLTNTTQQQQVASPAVAKAKKGKNKPDNTQQTTVVTECMLPQTVFEYLKSRNDIEQLNDTYKNVLEADKTYMQNEQTMEATTNLLPNKWKS